MTPKWITGLVRARQVAEDNAKQNLATAERLASRAHVRVRYNADRLDSLRYAGAEANAVTFVASAVALQAAAATHAAACQAAERADNDALHRREGLTDAAVSRRSAEELAARARAAEKAREALLAQKATDEIAASVFRRNHETHGVADTPVNQATVHGGSGSGTGSSSSSSSTDMQASDDASKPDEVQL
ncbi:MAG: hypothetical protein ABI382_06670 [Nakamurella sp.]